MISTFTFVQILIQSIILILITEYIYPRNIIYALFFAQATQITRVDGEDFIFKISASVLFIYF